MLQPLTAIKPGAVVRLGPPAGVDPDILQELWAMGLLPGQTMTVVAVIGRHGPVLVQGPGGVFALGRRLAARLQAEVRTA